MVGDAQQLDSALLIMGVSDKNSLRGLNFFGPIKEDNNTKKESMKKMPKYLATFYQNMNKSCTPRGTAAPHAYQIINIFWVAGAGV